jgi:uncharacterized surface protein with fasciclin (FAS1) repeats
MNKIHIYIIRLLPLLLVALVYSSCQKTTLTEPGSSTTFLPAADFLKNNYEFTLFYAAIQKAGLVDSLNGVGPFTIFAPDDNAFNLAGIHTAADFNSWSTDSLKFFVKYHMLNRKLFVSDVPVGIDNLYANADGVDLYLSIPQYDRPPLIVNGDSVSTDNLVMANGIIHEVTRVLKYSPGTVQNFLSRDPDLSYYVAALKKVNLWDSLKTANPYTVLAPSNEAFMGYGITPDSIARMSPANAANVEMFKIYILYPHHDFYSDAGVLGQAYVTIPPYPYAMFFADMDELGNGSVFSLEPGIVYNRAVPEARFAPPWALSIDNVTSNGIVDKIDNLLLH